LKIAEYPPYPPGPPPNASAKINISLTIESIVK